jgi:hypothetical protein
MVLKKLAADLKLLKLTFQLIRRMDRYAGRNQRHSHERSGHVEAQPVLGQRPTFTGKKMAKGVRATVKAICEELRKESRIGSDQLVLTPNDTNQKRRACATS